MTATAKTGPSPCLEGAEIGATVDDFWCFNFHHSTFNFDRDRAAQRLALRALSPETAAIVLRKSQDRLRRKR